MRLRYQSRRPKPAIFRRRMILQLTSLLDLLLIIVFVQYLEMQRTSAALREQRDRLLSGARGDLYQVWEVHLNGNRSPYPDGSILLSSTTQKKVIQPRDAADFAGQMLDAIKQSPRPPAACIFLLTWGNVTRDMRDADEARLKSLADDEQLQTAWGGRPVKFSVVEGGYMQEKEP